MNITSAQYMKGSIGNDIQSITATVDGIVMSVPLDPDNRHYQAILEWAKEDGNEIQAAE